jgi:hypothetical protein
MDLIPSIGDVYHLIDNPKWEVKIVDIKGDWDYEWVVYKFHRKKDSKRGVQTWTKPVPTFNKIYMKTVSNQN